MADAAPQHAVYDPAKSPLGEHLQTAAGNLAEWGAWGSIPIVTTFGHPQAEYAAIRKGCGLMARPERGVIHVMGKDSLTFLNNLLTNGLVNRETKTPLPVNHGTYSFLLNLKGRVVAGLTILNAGDLGIFCEVDAIGVPALITAIDSFRFREQAKMVDVSSQWSVLNLHGPAAVDVLHNAADAGAIFEPTPADFPATIDLPVARIKLAGRDAIAWRDDLCGVPGVGVLVPSDSIAAVWDDLVARFGQTEDERDFGRRRVRPVGWAMFNACRIEAGTPLLGIDVPLAAPSKPGKKPDLEEAAREDPKGGALPAETGPLFEKAVSVTSGCYLGQEIVARMHARKVVAKKIVGIRMDEDRLPTAGVVVEIDGNVVGAVTSSTLSPVLSNACICLALIKRPHFEVGTVVTIAAEGRHATGRIVELPFVKVG